MVIPVNLALKGELLDPLKIAEAPYPTEAMAPRKYAPIVGSRVVARATVLECGAMGIPG